jgi:PHD/YefM family antitoxin component YafN of YafNO toxin-antitoxin module
MSTTCHSRKDSPIHKIGVITLQGEEYCIVPRKEYDGFLETAAIMSDPEAYERLKESFADPIKKRFSSIEEIEKDLDSDGNWE